MTKPSDQLTAYIQRKGEKLEELADHHALIGEGPQAKELYSQAREMYERIANQEFVARIDEKLKKLE